MSAERRMNVRRIPREKDATSAIRGRLLRSIRPRRDEAHRTERHVLAGDAPQHRLHVLERDLRAMEGAAVEVAHPDHARLPLRVRAGRRGVASERKHRRIFELHTYRVTGELAWFRRIHNRLSSAPCSVHCRNRRNSARGRFVCQRARRFRPPRYIEALDAVTTRDLDDERTPTRTRSMQFDLDPEQHVSRTGHSVASPNAMHRCRK